MFHLFVLSFAHYVSIDWYVCSFAIVQSLKWQSSLSIQHWFERQSSLKLWTIAICKSFAIIECFEWQRSLSSAIIQRLKWQSSFELTKIGEYFCFIWIKIVSQYIQESILQDQCVFVEKLLTNAWLSACVLTYVPMLVIFEIDSVIYLLSLYSS